MSSENQERLEQLSLQLELAIKDERYSDAARLKKEIVKVGSLLRRNQGPGLCMALCTSTFRDVFEGRVCGHVLVWCTDPREQRESDLNCELHRSWHKMERFWIRHSASA